MSKKRPDDAVCETCVFYCQTQARDDQRNWSARGECRRRAAIVHPDPQILASWPLVDAADWCGEWSDTWPGGDSHG